MSSSITTGLACKSLMHAVQKSTLEEIRTRLGKETTTMVEPNYKTHRGVSPQEEGSGPFN